MRRFLLGEGRGDVESYDEKEDTQRGTLDTGTKRTRLGNSFGKLHVMGTSGHRWTGAAFSGRLQVPEYRYSYRTYSYICVKCMMVMMIRLNCPLFACDCSSSSSPSASHSPPQYPYLPCLHLFLHRHPPRFYISCVLLLLTHGYSYFCSCAAASVSPSGQPETNSLRIKFNRS